MLVNEKKTKAFKAQTNYILKKRPNQMKKRGMGGAQNVEEVKIALTCVAQITSMQSKLVWLPAIGALSTLEFVVQHSHAQQTRLTVQAPLTSSTFGCFLACGKQRSSKHVTPP